MAYDKTNRRLYVDESSDKGGIALWQIADCLRYYKRDTNGKRNLGTIIKNADINKWAKYKPERMAGIKAPITLDQRIANNFSFKIPVGSLQSRPSGWQYLRPRGTTYNESYRARDFDGYNHLAKIPLDFYFSNGLKSYSLNTIIQKGLPPIKVVYRLNDSTYSPEKSNAELHLEDFNIDGVATGTIGDYIACALASNSSGYFLANAKDTLNLKFGTSISDYVINLADFNIEDAAADASDDTTNFPEDAEEKKILTIYPLINKFTPSSLGQVFSASESNPTSGAPTATLGGNGYTIVSDAGLIGVPDGSALKIYIYKYSPIKVDYGVINYIANGSTTVVSTWGFTLSSASYNTNVRELGGVTLNFASAKVTVRMTFTLYNQSDDDVVAYIKSFSDPSGVFPKTSNVSVQSGLADGKDYILMPAWGSQAVTILATYEVGARTNYTFASMTSPSYGALKPEIEIAYAQGESHTPKLYGEQKEVRWR